LQFYAVTSAESVAILVLNSVVTITPNAELIFEIEILEIK